MNLIGQLGKGKSAEARPSPLRNVAFLPSDEPLLSQNECANVKIQTSAGAQTPQNIPWTAAEIAELHALNDRLAETLRREKLRRLGLQVVLQHPEQTRSLLKNMEF